MKKLVSFVLAAVLCVGMTTTVLADGSPVISDDIKGTISEIESDATDVTVKSFEDVYDDYTDAEKAAVDEVADKNVVLAEVKKSVSNATAVEKVVQFDLHATGAGTFKFTVDGISASDNGKVLVLHFTNGAWKNMNATVNAAGEVEVFFDGNYSPVMIIKYAASIPTPPPVQDLGTPVAPKTADVTMLGLVAVAALAGAVTAGRKVNK